MVSSVMVSNSSSYPFTPGTGGFEFTPSNLASIRNSIIANNGPVNFSSAGGYTSDSHSIIASATNLFLGPLTNNGGPTLTHALLPGSPAIDAGDDTLTGTDQRGRPRRSGAHVDIGAFEFTAPTFAGLRKLTNDAVTLTTVSDAPFSVVANPNVAAPSNQWINLGPATAISHGLYEFTDTTATNNPLRFFRLRWP